MLHRITLENFFSFGKPTTIELNKGNNILLGINGSGKSNFLKAIKLLYESVAGNGFEKIFLGDWGGFESVGNFSETKSDVIKLCYEFDKDALNKITEHLGYNFIFKSNPIYDIRLHRQGNSSYYIEEDLRSLKKHGEKNDFIYIQSKNRSGIISTRTDEKISLKSFFNNDGELILRQISDPDRFYPQFILRRAIESISVYNYFDTTLKSEIRKPSNYGIDPKLLTTGVNLVQILQRIKGKHTIQYGKLENLLRDVNRNFLDISFDLLGPKVLLALREKNLDKTVSVEHISDGTLRFLLLLAIYYNPERGSIVCIDEPETGLHPDMINMVAEMIKSSTKDSQNIVATHSPLLLNSFNIEDCIMFEKNKSNETIVSKKTEDDFPDWNDDYLVGQLWLKGKIGAKRW